MAGYIIRILSGRRKFPFLGNFNRNYSSEKKKQYIKRKEKDEIKYTTSEMKEIMGVYTKLAYFSGVVETIDELKQQGSLDELVKIREMAKQIMPKQIYDSKEVQVYMRRIKQGINHWKQG